ncbi:hypothetical protein Rumeso_02557 [Rubellimicrobium mesophilum DSM 19309]|uniref:DUF2849 domain-containing protein n=1 Tax=Rubellimicrobium mesophilum DSM 19309 TaxID=442562 RepID=A0A017HN76_9RHOB|nr:DUF2849 domain-containing protein [Rubellimicrobium mesophilum]EYD75775.1 hypothetical protein Rumeso_02557 [Rubellimicrobium mesophilum DSM 19309]
MSRRFTPKVVSANHLVEGDAVWLTADDRWTRDMAEAELIEDEAVAQLRLLFAKGQPNTVVGAELVDAAKGTDGPVPTHFREAFRTHGPTNYVLGKRAQGLRSRGKIPGNETQNV